MQNCPNCVLFNYLKSDRVGSVRKLYVFERRFYFLFALKHTLWHLILVIYALYTTYLSKSRFDNIRLNIHFDTVSCISIPFDLAIFISNKCYNVGNNLFQHFNKRKSNTAILDYSNSKLNMVFQLWGFVKGTKEGSTYLIFTLPLIHSHITVIKESSEHEFNWHI